MTVTVQNVFASSFPDFQERYNPSYDQVKVANNIINCRTSTLGTYAFSCESKECDHTMFRHYSCRNRHCPMCQGVNKEIWVDQRKKDILNAPYYHVVFTMPEQLKMMIYHNQQLLYDLMFKAVAETLMELSEDEKYLGAKIGFLSVLHTWGQNLHYHPHIHTVVLAGGLNRYNQWKQTSEKFFLPVKVLSKKFRGKFLYYLKQLYQKKLLSFFGEASLYKDPKQFQKLIDSCYALDWYSYTKRPFAGPWAVMEYLSRYTQRIAISNQRLISVDEKDVTFRVRDYKDKNKQKKVTMASVEFIRRFLMHVLPKGFVKLRYYGLLANRVKADKLTLCRALTKSPIYESIFEGLSYIEILSLIFQKDLTLCPKCKKAHLKSSLSGDTS